MILVSVDLDHVWCGAEDFFKRTDERALEARLAVAQALAHADAPDGCRCSHCGVRTQDIDDIVAVSVAHLTASPNYRSCLAMPFCWRCIGSHATAKGRKRLSRLTKACLGEMFTARGTAMN